MPAWYFRHCLYIVFSSPSSSVLLHCFYWFSRNWSTPSLYDLDIWIRIWRLWQNGKEMWICCTVRFNVNDVYYSGYYCMFCPECVQRICLENWNIYSVQVAGVMISFLHFFWDWYLQYCSVLHYMCTAHSYKQNRLNFWKFIQWNCCLWYYGQNGYNLC